MEIQEIKVFNAPSIFSVREPIVKIQVKLGELAEIPTKDIENINEDIIKLFPGIKDHKCAKGYVGGFVERLQEGTYLAHVTEHLCLETQRMLGYDIKHGKARQVKDDIYNIIFSCTHAEIGKACGNFVIDTLNALIEGQEVNIDKQIRELSKLCANYDLSVSTMAIIEEAKKRDIPVSLVNDGQLISLGYGKYQKLISATLHEGSSSIAVSPFIEMMFPKNMPLTIPIVSITGTNGKTTTTRMISRILKNAGYSVGTTTTHGIYINDKCLEEGDTTGPKSARRILYNKEVDAAVLETARGGIIRDGLAYEKADVAVFTNLTEDHLGTDGINTLEELLHVKSLVIEAVKDDGACVLNADDPLIMKVKEKASGKLVLFSSDENNPLLINHINNLGWAVFIKGNSIYVTNNGNEKEIIKISDIPATLNGGLQHNVYNSMAAIGACYSLRIPLKIISDTLRAFSCDADVNPGRFNVYDLGDFKIVLDYGHNIEGYRVTIEGLKHLNPRRLIGIIGVPGDRRDEDIEKIGELSGLSFDRIIIKEDEDLRGRMPFEVAKLLLKGVLQGNADKNNVKIIQRELEALKDAVRNVKSGDIIVLFFEKMDPLIKFLKNYKKQGAYLNLSREPIFV